MNVVEGSHCCCENPGFTFRLKVSSGCFGIPTYTSCPSYSASPPALASCTPSGSCSTPGNATSYSVSVVNSAWNYSKWKLNTIDLSSFIGNCVTVELTAFDCPYSAHAGYTYFDAQSSPLDIIVNGNAYPAGIPMLNVSNCGAGATATITAPMVAGGYTWTTPGSYTIVPGSGGQTIYTGTTGNHTLLMSPPGSCSPIIRVINLINSPAPNMIIPTFTQSSCTNFNNGISVMMSSGTATNNPWIPQYTVVFSPAYPTGTVGVSANTATYTGLSVGVNTITIIDSVGCKATQTINVNGVPAIPSFSINAPSGTVIGCSPPFIPLNAVNTSTDPVLASAAFSYTWNSAFSSSVTQNYNATSPTTYTVFAQATYTTPTGSALSCITASVITVTGSTLIPICNVTPISRTITCNGSCATFTAATSSGTTNVVGAWYNSSGQISPPATTPLVACFNAPGTYTAQFCSTISGCCSSQTVAVVSNSTIPTITVTPTTFNGFTINCTNPYVGLQVNTSALLGPFGYTWTPLPSGPATTPPSGGYTVTVPGQYEIKFHGGNMCDVTQTITVFIDTLRPSPLSITNLPSNSYTLNCFSPTLIATGITNPLLPPSSYSWTVPPSLSFPSNTISVGLVNITSSTTPTTYTVSAMGPNGCIGRAKVNFYKNIYVPPYTAVFTPSAITCVNPCVAMSPFTSSTVSVTYTFTSPPPTQTATTAGALMCNPGTYTMTYMNLNNGCTNSTTTVVPQNVTSPSVTPQPTVYIPCGATTAVISAGTVTTASTYSYTWDSPIGASMSCLGGTACATSSVNAPGIYNVYVLNTANGCSSTNSVLVIQATSLPLSITANTAICSGDISVLTASGATSYTWSTGSNSNPIGVSPTVTTTYSLSGVTTGTCAGQTSITISVIAGPPVAITGNTTICSGETATLNAVGPLTYTWSTGSNGSAILVTPTVNTTYTLSSQSSGTNNCISQSTFTVTVDPCVGIKELEWSKNISIAPNPNSGKFSVDISATIEYGELKIINAIGQEVFKQNIKQGKNEINCGGLAKGIYHYNIYQNKQPVSRGKIIIE